MLSNESKIIETVCPQLAEFIALNCAKISQVEMELKSLQRKMSTRKERGEKGGGSLNHKVIKQAETAAEVRELV